MKLSIIVPAYNAQDKLPVALERLVIQDVNPYEIIIVNDGSTDNTQKVIDDYKSKYPELIRSISVSNGGQGRARNFALRECRGDYVGFCDADDVCAPDMFKKMLDKAYSTDADIVVCDFYRVDKDGQHYEKAAMQDNRLSCAGAVWNKIFRRAAIGGVRFAEGLWYEDLAFSAKMLIKCSKVEYIPEALYYYNVGHTSTMTNQNSRKNLDIITVVENIRSFANKEKLDADIDFLVINHILLESLKRVSCQKGSDRQEVIDELLKYVHENIPDLDKCQAYLNETRNRRMVMKLLYNGHTTLVKNILKIV